MEAHDPILCTWCRKEIEPGTKFLVVFRNRSENGFNLYEGCDHRMDFIRDLIRYRDPLGFAGSMDCLGAILMRYAEDCKDHDTN